MANFRSMSRFGMTVLMGALLASCWFLPTVWREKVTISVSTPDGVKTASSVTSIAFYDTTKERWMLPEARNVRFEKTGEAVVLEIAPGRYLFTLLAGLPDATQVFFPEMQASDAGPRIPSLSETRNLKPKQYPLLVTFDDINNPASVKRVDPANLEATFGPGYRLNGITLSLTKEPVTKGEVEKVLGWWCEYRTKSARLNGSTSSAISTNELPDVLGTGAFRVGDCSL